MSTQIFSNQYINALNKHLKILNFNALQYTLLVFIVHLLCVEGAIAKVFRNDYVSFELPSGWDCKLEKTEWVCQGKQDALKEAIIILTAKEVGVIDSLDQYTTYLKTPRQIVGDKGQSIRSQVQDVRNRKIANHNWVDGRHLSSELPNFYTRYLATTKSSIAILVTFSAHKTEFSKYSPAFIRAINSLRVIATDALLNNPTRNALRGSNESIGGSIQSAFPLDMYADEELPNEPTAKSRRMKRLLTLLLLSAGGIGGYLFFTRDKS